MFTCISNLNIWTLWIESLILLHASKKNTDQSVLTQSDQHLYCSLSIYIKMFENNQDSLICMHVLVMFIYGTLG